MSVIEANKELGRILDEQLATELTLAQKQLEIANLKKAADGDTLETEEAIYDARIKIAEINERIESQRSEQLTNTNALIKDQTTKELEAAKLKAEQLAEVQALNDENEILLYQQKLTNKADLDRAALEQKEKEEIAFAKSIGADTALIEQRYAKAREDINKEEAKEQKGYLRGFCWRNCIIGWRGYGSC